MGGGGGGWSVGLNVNITLSIVSIGGGDQWGSRVLLMRPVAVGNDVHLYSLEVTLGKGVSQVTSCYRYEEIEI